MVCVRVRECVSAIVSTNVEVPAWRVIAGSKALPAGQSACRFGRPVGRSSTVAIWRNGSLTVLPVVVEGVEATEVSRWGGAACPVSSSPLGPTAFDTGSNWKSTRRAQAHVFGGLKQGRASKWACRSAQADGHLLISQTHAGNA